MHIGVGKIINYVTRNNNQEDYVKLLKLTDPVVNYLDYEHIEKLRSIVHVAMVVLVSVAMSIYPIIYATRKYFNIDFMPLQIIVCIVIIIVMSYRVYRSALIGHAFSKLIPVGIIEYIDYKKYSEYISGNIATKRINLANDRIKQYIENINKK